MAKIAFIFLGVMGFPTMALNLIKGGQDVTVYNRTAAKAAKWKKAFGGKIAKTPRKTAKAKDFVLVCVRIDVNLRIFVLGEMGVLAEV